MWAKSPYYVNPSPSLSRNTSVDVPSKAPSMVSSRQPSVESQAHQHDAPPPGLVTGTPSFHSQMHPPQSPPPSILKPSIVIDVEQLATEPSPDSPIILPIPSAMASKRNSAVIVEEIMRSRALARVKRQSARELRFSFAESPSTSVETSQQSSRPRFHSISHNTEFVQHRISLPPEPVKIIEIDPQVVRKPTSYYEVFPLEAYDNRTERQKRKEIPRHDPRYQASLREEFEIRKYTLIAIGICIFITITVGGFTIWQVVMDFTIDF
ncbi:hypothetical protein PMAYCL1PPCAC_30071 [Pristionchus mayeri]|uniref:Uncharacterized protein n=1 Tax=Pristionchus mayeri TaxID=1317129 RepID=A0AAN5DBA6_9BILA|nr:hypothetical protein PMAYCL1PPCAC_30071 [Pristionchus mayeri]